jgi:hypothetical protein
VPRAVYDLFNFLKEASAEGTSAVVTCSYLQIYNDKLYDLLADRCVACIVACVCVVSVDSLSSRSSDGIRSLWQSVSRSEAGETKCLSVACPNTGAAKTVK